MCNINQFLFDDFFASKLIWSTWYFCKLEKSIQKNAISVIPHLFNFSHIWHSTYWHYGRKDFQRSYKHFCSNFVALLFHEKSLIICERPNPYLKTYPLRFWRIPLKWHVVMYVKKFKKNIFQTKTFIVF